LSLVIVFLWTLLIILINLIILRNNAYAQMDENINENYLKSFKDLSREVAATMAIHKNISQYSIVKTTTYLKDILEASSVSLFIATKRTI
jgi:hypothetical protein